MNRSVVVVVEEFGRLMSVFLDGLFGGVNIGRLTYYRFPAFHTSTVTT